LLNLNTSVVVFIPRPGPAGLSQRAASESRAVGHFVADIDI
jgi:hypothetical protein